MSSSSDTNLSANRRFTSVISHQFLNHSTPPTHFKHSSFCFLSFLFSPFNFFLSDDFPEEAERNEKRKKERRRKKNENIFGLEEETGKIKILQLRKSFRLQLNQSV